MIRATHTKTFNDFVLNDSLPERLEVCQLSDPEDKTTMYGVVADYGWAEQILFSGAYLRDANSIARIVGEFLDIPVAQAGTAAT